MVQYAHKGQILPLANQMIPIDKQTTFHASYDYHLNGMNQGDLVTTNGPTYACKFSAANNDAVNLPFGNGWDPTVKRITVDFWAQANSASMVSCMAFGPSNGTNQRFYIGVGNTGKWEIGLQTVGWAGGTVAVTTNWVHVKMIAENGTAKLYIDDVLSDTVTYTSYTIASNFSIGGMNGGGYAWDGQIADFKIYVDGVLYSWHKLSETEGKILYDASGNGNEASRVNAMVSTYGPTIAVLQKGQAKFGGAVLIEQDTNNWMYPSNISTWRGTTGNAGTVFRGEPVYYNTALNTGGGFGFVPTGTPLDLNPGDKAVTSIWINRGTANLFPGYYMQGRTYDTATATWTSRDPMNGYFSRTFYYYDENGNDITSGFNLATFTGWAKQVCMITNTHTDKIRFSGTWFFLDYGFTSGTCYWSMPQLEYREWATSYVKGSRPVGKLWYPKELINPAAFTIGCWFNIPHMHTAVTNNAGIQGSWYHPIIEMATPTISSSSIRIVAGPQPSPYLRKLAIQGIVGSTSSFVVQDNTWYHLICTYDGTTYKVYVDGTQQIATTGTVITPGSSEVLMVGGGYYGKPNIMIDELRIESRAISADEAAAWAASGLHYNYLDYSQYVD
jgi:hypothetical protein